MTPYGNLYLRSEQWNGETTTQPRIDVQVFVIGFPGPNLSVNQLVQWNGAVMADPDESSKASPHSSIETSGDTHRQR